MKNRDILISGASIAGPALAYWLRRHGFNPTVVERSPAPRSGGQAIDLRGTARTVVERMGVLEAIKQAHTGTRGMSVVNGAGKRLSSMSSETMNGSGGLIAEIEILRGDLVHILYDATRMRWSISSTTPSPASRRTEWASLSPSRGPRRAPLISSSAPMGCTRMSAGWRSARSHNSRVTWAAMWRSSCGERLPSRWLGVDLADTRQPQHGGQKRGYLPDPRQ